MVDERAVERLRGAGEATGGPLVAVARRRIAARMIVGEDDSGAPVKRRVGDDRAERELGAALVARVARQVQAMRLVVEMGSNPTGSWQQYPEHLATFSSAGCRFVAPIPGLAVLVKTTGTMATYNAEGWDLGTDRGTRVMVDGLQVVGSQAAQIPDPAGGATIDVEARTTLEQVLSALRQHGLIANE